MSRETDILEKYPKSNSLDTTGFEEEPVVVITNTSLPAEKQYLNQLKKESANFEIRNQNFEPFDFEFQDDAWDDEIGQQQSYIPKKGFA